MLQHSMRAGVCGRAYRWHQLISTPHARHLVLVDELLERAFHRLIPSHEHHVRTIQREQHQRLLPIYMAVPETVYQHQQADRVKGAVAEQRPPGECQSCAGKQRARTDHKQYIEHRGAHDRPDAHVVERYEHANDGGEEFWRGTSRGHERSAGHVVADGQPLDDNVECRHEELIAHDSERHEHVPHADDVQEYRTRAALLLAEQVCGEERGLLLFRWGRGADVERVGGVGLGPRRR